MKFETTPFDPKRAKQLLAEAGYANGLDAGDITPLPPYTTVGETVSGMLQAVGIKSRVRTMERATFLTTWREKKLRGLLIGATGAAGNAETRIEPFFTKSGFYAYGSLPQIDELFQSQARETDRKRREAQLHQIQQIVHDQVLAAPIFQQAFLCAVGARVAESGLGLIQGFPYAGPAEELRLK
jgi:ABC-type transport system substrate-binding protein